MTPLDPSRIRPEFHALGLETGGVLRLGIAHDTAADQVDRLLEALETVARRPDRLPAIA